MSGTQLDPSIISNAMAQIAQNDGPQNMQGWMAVKNANLQNQLLQSQQASGADFQKAINPQTGQVDYSKYNALLAGDPRAAFSAQDASQRALANQATAQANLQAEAQTYLDRHNVLSGIAGGWMQNQNLSRSNVMDDVVDAISKGILSPSDGANVVKSYDPQNPQAWAKNEFDALTAQAGQVQKLLPQAQPISTGGQTVMAQGNPLASGYLQPMAGYQNTLSPGEAAQPITVQGAGGAQQEPLGAYAAQTGNGNLLTGAGGGLGTGRVPQPSGGNALTGAGMPAAQPSAQAGGTAPLGAGAPATQVQTGGAAPGWQGFSFPSWAKPGNTYVPAGLDAEQKAGSDLYTADMGNVSNAAQQINQLQSIISESAGANTGALARFFENAGSTAQQLGLTNGQQATDLQLVQKNVSQLVTSQLGSIGAPTDAKMNEVIYGTPNATMTGDAIKGTSAQLIGAIQWKQTEMQAFQNYQQAAAQAGYPVSAGAYAQFNAQWQKKVPVAAFQLQSMPPALRAQYLKSVGKEGARAIYQATTSTIPSLGVSLDGQ